MGLIPFNPISKKFSVGGRDFTVSALPCGVVRYKLWPLSDDLAQGKKTLGEAFDEMVSLILASMKPAEPELTKEDLLDGLINDDISEMFKEVCRVSGMRRSDVEKPEAEGVILHG